MVTLDTNANLKRFIRKVFTWELIIFHCLSQEAMKVIKKKYTKTNCRRHTTYYYYQLLLLRPSKSKGRSSKKGKIHTISCAKLLYFTKKIYYRDFRKKIFVNELNLSYQKNNFTWFFVNIYQLKFNLGKKLDTHMELQMLVLDTIVNSIIKKKVGLIS